MTFISRRTVLGGTALIGGVSLLGLRDARAALGGADPFTLGVASGDPASDGMVLRPASHHRR